MPASNESQDWAGSSLVGHVQECRTVSRLEAGGGAPREGRPAYSAAGTCTPTPIGQLTPVPPRPQ